MKMNDTLVATLILGIVLEFVLSITWSRFYFRFGIPIFRTRVGVNKEFSFSEALSQRGELADTFSAKQISSNEIAIRERFLVLSRSATLHGLIRLSPGRDELVAWAFINWTLLFLVGLFAVMLSGAPGFAWLIVLVIISSIGVHKIKQFKKFVGEIGSDRADQINE